MSSPRGMVNAIEHLEQRVLLAAAAQVTDDGDLLSSSDIAGAAAVEATVETRVLLTFVPDKGGSAGGLLRASVTAHRATDATDAPVGDVGRVMFYRNGKSLKRAGVSVIDGMAQLPVVQQPGIYSFEARYEGSGVLLSSASAAIEADVRRAQHVSLTHGVVYAKDGQRLTLNARLGPHEDFGIRPRGKVTFHDRAGRIIGSAKVVNGHASTSVILPLGKHRLTATYSGDKRHRPAGPGTQTLRVYHRTTVDLMVAYTPAALVSMGGHKRVRREIIRAVDAVNAVLRNSRVNVSVRLVAAVLVEYGETRDYERDLKRLADENDGHLDVIPSQRHGYGADLVSLLVGRKGKGAVVGTAYRMTRTADAENERFAYSVVHAASAAGPDYALAHELAHNFGAAHDRKTAPPGPIAAPYAHGFTGVVKGEQVRDVMGYPPGRTIPYFSNPRIKYGGVRIGDERRADVARLITETAPLVAAYREQKVAWGERLICTCW